MVTGNKFSNEIYGFASTSTFAKSNREVRNFLQDTGGRRDEGEGTGARHVSLVSLLLE